MMELSTLAACGLTKRALLDIGSQAGEAGDKMVSDMGTPFYRWNEEERAAFDCLRQLARYADRVALMLAD